MHFRNFIRPLWAVALFCLLSVDLIQALRDVRVKIPNAVRRGEKAALKCLYDLEGDSLYSVKWYKGRREFYSFTPKETPAMKVFQFAGVKVERSASNESQLVLESVNLATTGKYSCEVSADAPSFHTLISAGELEVVEVPGKDPTITGIRPRYRVGDIVRGNCTSRHSKPAANLTWNINGYETNPSHIRHHKPIKDARELETAISGIHFVVTPQHFNYGKLKIRCTAHIHDVYWKSTEKSIEEERHKHNSGNSINLVNTFSEDYFDLEEGNLLDRSDTYMTHIKGDVSSLNSSGGSVQHSSCLPLWPRMTILALLLYTLQQMLLLLRQMFSRNMAATVITKATAAAATKSKIIAATLAKRRRRLGRSSNHVNNESGNTKGQLVLTTSGTSGVAIATATATTTAEATLCSKGAKRHLKQQQQQTKTEERALIKRKAQQKQQYKNSTTTTLSKRSAAAQVPATTTTAAAAATKLATQCCLTSVITRITTTEATT